MIEYGQEKTQATIENPDTVYIVDDEVGVRKSMSGLVQRQGYTVLAFASAEEFLEYRKDAADVGCCCLILDVAMPGLNGIALQEALAKNAESMPIIFISGHGDIPTSVNAMKNGALDFLVKPVSGGELLGAIEVAIRKDREARVRRAEIAEVQDRIQTLTPRESEVMKLVVTGMLNKQIAAELGIEEGTVKIHRGRVMSKMGVISVAELVALCSKLDAAFPDEELHSG
jgi:FixJ family two-component response regulator